MNVDRQEVTLSDGRRVRYEKALPVSPVLVCGSG
jgi:hypothetical protein